MPLTSANYSGGIIITDWYSEQGNVDESQDNQEFLRTKLDLML